MGRDGGPTICRESMIERGNSKRQDLPVVVHWRELGKTDHRQFHPQRLATAQNRARTRHREIRWIDVPAEQRVAFLSARRCCEVAAENSQLSIWHQPRGSRAIAGRNGGVGGVAESGDRVGDVIRVDTRTGKYLARA